jgi:chromosome segregation ATPase
MALLALASLAAAQQAREGGGDARLQAMVQQLTAERAELQTENRELEAELRERAAELEAAQAEITSLRGDVAESSSSLEQSKATSDRNAALVAQLRARVEEIVAEFRRTAEVLRQTELERNELSAMLASKDSSLEQCITNNLALYQTGIEVLDQYEEKGCFTSARQRGPFTQLKRVEIENLVDEYRWRLEDGLLPQATDAAAAAPAGDAATPAAAASD